MTDIENTSFQLGNMALDKDSWKISNIFFLFSFDMSTLGNMICEVVQYLIYLEYLVFQNVILYRNCNSVIISFFWS